MRPRSGSFYALTLDPLNQLSVSQKAAISGGVNVGGRRKKHSRSDSCDADDESAPVLPVSSFKRLQQPLIRSKYAPLKSSPLRFQTPGSTKLKPAPRCHSDLYLMGAYSGLTLRDLDAQIPSLSLRAPKSLVHPPNRTLLRCVLRNRWIAGPNADLARRYGLRNAWQMEEDVKRALGYVKKHPISRTPSAWITLGDEWAASTLSHSDENVPVIGEERWEEFIFGLPSPPEDSEDTSSSGSDGTVSMFDSDSDEEEQVHTTEWEAV